MSTLLTVEHLSKHFTLSGGWFGPERRLDALTDINLTVEAGETLAIVGESGCGKTTLGRCIIKAQPVSEGRVVYHPKAGGHVELTALSKREIKPWRQDIRMIFQDPMSSLNPNMRVFDIVAEPLRVHKLLRGRELEARVYETLAKVGISPDAAGRYRERERRTSRRTSHSERHSSCDSSTRSRPATSTRGSGVPSATSSGGSSGSSCSSPTSSRCSP